MILWKAKTKKGLSLMNEQFVTYGSANVMTDNVTYEAVEVMAALLNMGTNFLLGEYPLYPIR